MTAEPVVTERPDSKHPWRASGQTSKECAVADAPIAGLNRGPAVASRGDVRTGPRSLGARDIIQPVQPVGKPTRKPVRWHLLYQFARSNQLAGDLALGQCAAQRLSDLRPDLQNR